MTNTPETSFHKAQPGRPETYPLVANDHDGNRPTLVLVPVNVLGRQRWVKIDKASFEALPKAAREAPWFLVRSARFHPSGKPDNSYGVRVGPQVRVARLIADAGPGEVVSHINLDRLDLRRTNLRVRTVGSGAKVATGKLPEKFAKRP